MMMMMIASQKLKPSSPDKIEQKSKYTEIKINLTSYDW